MTKRKSIYLIVLFVYLTSCVLGQTNEKKDYFRKRLDIINEDRALAFINKDIK